MDTFLKAMIAGLALGAMSAPALADFPERTIEIVVPFNAGGGTDTMTRIFAEHLTEHFGSPVVVVNRPGAGGEVGMTEVAEAEPDGYKLIVINTPNVLTIPTERDARFTYESFDLLGTIAEDPGTLSVLSSDSIETIEDLVEAATATPGEITYGTSGVGSAGHIAGLLFSQSADVELLNVPYTGSAAVRTALLNGDVRVATANLGEALNFADGNPWRILGVMASERVAGQPDLPTFAEAGYPILAGSLRGLGAPKGTPDDVLTTLRAGVAAVLADEDFLAASAEANVPIRYLDADEHAATLKAVNDNITALWEATPWRE
ncbi:MAG: tripartite tricarboxylate transporter substrate binding protein [Pseudomonadota bacterium]